MDAKELETFNVQLSQVELELSKSPDDDDLLSLRDELKELIALTEQNLKGTESKSAPKAALPSIQKNRNSTVTAAYNTGDEVMAKFSGDNAWYPAKIVSIGGSDDRRMYSIVFKGYNTTELLEDSQLKPMPQSALGGSSSSSTKRKFEEDSEKERKKKKNEKKAEARAVKAKEQSDKQVSWQKFAKKSEKRGTPIAGVSGTSIFKTPDNPHGRVGVTGSGQGMTDYTPRNKHKYDTDEQQLGS